MLKRIYIDNYLCFINFELKLETVNLLMGANGSGKTSVFKVLDKVCRLILNGEKVSELFKQDSITRWQKDILLQTIELDISGNDGLYRYRLEIEHLLSQQGTRIKNESLMFNNQQLYRFSVETDISGSFISTVHLFNDNPDHPGTAFPSDWTRSFLFMCRKEKIIKS